MTMKFRTASIVPPPIVELSLAARRFASRPDYLDLGQGVPGFIPPRAALAVLSDRIHHPSAHRYTPDEGHIELREELAVYLRRMSGVLVDPEREVVITAGANQAFAGVVLTVVSPGDRVIMPAPYYFNSYMAVQIAGGIPVPAPVDHEFQPVPEVIEGLVDSRTRVVLLVSPNNPTGAVYERSRIDQIVDICLEHDLLLVSDETYARLVFDDARHYSARSRRDACENVVMIGSFSKDFGMSGWRVGYIVAPEHFVREYLKVHDTVTICAPTAGQLLALEVLRYGLDTLDDEIRRMAALRDLAYRRAFEIDALEVVRTAGTFYMFPRVRSSLSTRGLALDILEKKHIFLLPGSLFGEVGEGHLRLSLGPLTADAVDEAFDRLASYFASRP